MKDFYIADSPRFENEVVTSYFCLGSIAVREKKTGGGQYLALTLADKTGTFEARMWDGFADAIGTCGDGCYVKVKGQISKYQGKFQITLQQMRLAAENEVDPSDFQAVSKYDPAEMEAELRGYVAAFANADLKRLALAFLDDAEIGGAFRVAPAAKYLHHAWLHGLLEHVLTLVRVCRATAPFYPEVDPELLVTGAILHDIGKVRELHWKPNFGYTIEGQMIGHISIAQGMLIEKVRELQPFPERLRVLVEHMILSHHGKYEFGSPKLPMTPEAMLLNVLDDLEAKMQNMRSEFGRELANGKSGAGMTEWVRSMERPLLNSQAYLAEGAAESAKREAPEPETVVLERATVPSLLCLTKERQRLTGVSLRDTLTAVIKSFKHSGLEAFFKTGSKRGIDANHAAKLEDRLVTLDLADKPAAMNQPGWGLHPLTGTLAGHWSVKVNGNWRLTFRFEGADAVLVDYLDYH